MTDDAPATSSDTDARLIRRLALAHFVLAVATLYFAWSGYVRLLAGQYVVEHADEPVPDEYATLFQLVTHFQSASGGYRPDDLRYTFGLALVLTGATLIALSLVHSVALALVGRWILRRQRYRLCLVFTFFDVTYIPLGMALSIFALIVLFRPGVKRLFQTTAAADSTSTAIDAPASTAPGASA